MSSTRREFLKRSLSSVGLLSLGTTAVPALLAKTAMAAHGRGDTILIVIQLSGGNDGLNTVVPYEDDHYHRARPTLRLAARQLHKIHAGLGFHPQMQAFQRLYKEGHLSIVQGVSYPHSSQNHQAAMQDWHAALIPAAESQTGWLGRVVDRLDRPDAPGIPGVFVGPIALPFAMNAQRAIVPVIRTIDECTLRADAGGQLPQAAALPQTGAAPLLEFVRRSAAAAYAGSARVEEAVRAASSTARYPELELAEHFRTMAQLIRADLGIRIYFSELGGDGFGGFDNHANQAANHGALLHHLSESVAAFVDDLQRDKLLDRVLLMTFSEFGRTVAENGRRGTDHGVAAPMFLAGGRLKGGLIGSHPQLGEIPPGGGLPFHTDFRQVYATALDQWLGVDSQAVLGKRFQPVTMLQG